MAVTVEEKNNWYTRWQSCVGIAFGKKSEHLPRVHGVMLEVAVDAKLAAIEQELIDLGDQPHSKVVIHQNIKRVIFWSANG